MKKYEILYDWPLDHIRWICDSAGAELFADALEENSLKEFVALTEAMRNLGSDLARARDEKLLFSRWTDLLDCFERFEQQYSSFPDLRAKKFRLSVLLARKLTQALPPEPPGAPELNEVDVNEELFELRNLAEALPLSWFVRENGTSFSDSIVVMSCADMPALEPEIIGANISPTLLFHFLARLNVSADVPATHTALVKKEDPAIEGPAVEAFVKLVILASGRPVHSPRSHASTPFVIDRDSFRAGTPYQQLNDVFNVLSEYNSRKETLTKYLTLYHVIENFMFKLPIVDLERQRDGRMFSIRDFRRLYKRISESEISALKQLFIVTFRLTAKPGTTFGQQVITRWEGLIPGTAEIDIEKALAALDLKKDNRGLKHAEFKTGDLAGNFAQLVYSVRNATVHNKETEFHLTYATLDNTIGTLIESFLIPCLEEMCFALLGQPNQVVWYQTASLRLY